VFVPDAQSQLHKSSRIRDRAIQQLSVERAHLTYRLRSRHFAPVVVSESDEFPRVLLGRQGAGREESPHALGVRLSGDREVLDWLLRAAFSLQGGRVGCGPVTRVTRRSPH
jgi:hypothetical protein